MRGIIKRIGGSMFIKLPKTEAKELHLVEGTILEIDLKERTPTFLWAKGAKVKLSAKKFKERLKKEKFWS